MERGLIYKIQTKMKIYNFLKWMTANTSLLNILQHLRRDNPYTYWDIIMVYLILRNAIYQTHFKQ